MESYLEGFKKLAWNPELLMQLLENIDNRKDYPLAPKGLRVYWNTLCKSNGWKLQKNYYYNHCRIVDEYNVIRARGEESKMISILTRLA